MHIVTTHKGTDFDALASMVAANLLYPDVVAVLPATLNPNVRAFLSLHRGLFDFCTPEKVNLDAAFGVFVLEGDRCLVIGRSNTAGINVASIMRHMGGGGHPGAGSALLKSTTAASVEEWIRVLIGEAHRSSTRIQDLMSSPVLTFPSDMPMQRAGILLRERRCHGAPVVENGKLVGVLSVRDFDKIKKKNQLRRPVKAFMSTDVVTISKNDSPGHAAHLMVKNDIGRLPVIDNGNVVGIFSRSDAVADFYGMCNIGRKLSTGCGQNEITSSDL